jgi:excisionase family DNA binding protein
MKAAKILGVSRMEVNRMIRSGKIAGSFKIGRMWALERAEVIKVKNQKEQGE